MVEAELLQIISTNGFAVWVAWYSLTKTNKTLEKLHTAIEKMTTIIQKK